MIGILQRVHTEWDQKSPAGVGTYMVDLERGFQVVSHALFAVIAESAEFRRMPNAMIIMEFSGWLSNHNTHALNGLFKFTFDLISPGRDLVYLGQYGPKTGP